MQPSAWSTKPSSSAPSRPDVRALWNVTDSRLARHQGSFGVTGANLLGEKSRIVTKPGFAVRRHVASPAAIALLELSGGS